jgi:Molybdopterin oxidoreductase Fe4S4 domain/Molybdopterin oxidoreductase
MKVTRRDLLVWSAGAAAGLLATPVPWKVLDDVSIWSQNWPWIPQPTRGPVEVKQSFCTLCPKACGLRVRMAAGWAVGVAGSSTHPISRGALCPLAFAAHQLNWHPQRLRSVRHGLSVSTWAEAQAAFANASKEGPVVVVDGYPGRAASSVLETFAAKQGGSYRVVPTAELRALAPYEQWTGIPAASLGYDFENARTIVSFGAPLLDGWGTPGRFTRLWAERAAGSSDPQLRLIQIDSSLSRTAARARQWIQIREGSESALASGLAGALLEQNLVPAHSPVPSMTLAESAAQTGLSVERIRELACMVVANTPALVVAGDDDPAVAALNVLLGSLGKRGGILRHSERVKAYVAAGREIGNARAVLIDASVPWDFVTQGDAEVFRFGAWDGGATKADWLLPAPGFLEELTDLPTAPGCSAPTYGVAPALMKATAEVQSVAQFLCSLDGTLPTTAKIIDSRCEELFRRREGSVYTQEIASMAKFSSVQSFKEQLWKGAVWAGEPALGQQFNCSLTEWPISTRAVSAESWSTDWSAPVMPPLASKLYQESGLRESSPRRNA